MLGQKQKVEVLFTRYCMQVNPLTADHPVLGLPFTRVKNFANRMNRTPTLRYFQWKKILKILISY